MGEKRRKMNGSQAILDGHTLDSSVYGVPGGQLNFDPAVTTSAGQTHAGTRTAELRHEDRLVGVVGRCECGTFCNGLREYSYTLGALRLSQRSGSRWNGMLRGQLVHCRRSTVTASTTTSLALVQSRCKCPAESDGRLMLSTSDLQVTELPVLKAWGYCRNTPHRSSVAARPALRPTSSSQTWSWTLDTRR